MTMAPHMAQHAAPHTAAQGSAPARTGEPGDPSRAGRGKRLVGVDAARGLALVGMVAVHTLPVYDAEAQRATLAWSLFSGHASALFALLAGVGLAFGSGGPAPRTGRALTAARCATAVRALLLGLVGLSLSLLPLPVANILPYYATLFLLALPFLGLRIRHLLTAAAAAMLLTPFLMQLALDVLPPDVHGNPSLRTLAAHPEAVLPQLLLTGTYPALPWLAFLLTGLAIGRMDLREVEVQVRLMLAGAGLAVLGWGASAVALGPLGGYDAIAAATPQYGTDRIDEVIVYGPDPELPTTTLWWLTVPGPHTNTPFAIALSLGVAVAALGLFLLLTRAPAPAAVLRPLTAAGAMTFTLYTAHLVLMAQRLHTGAPVTWFWVQAATALVLALLWRRLLGQGPLERAVATASRAAGRAVLGRGPAAARADGA